MSELEIAIGVLIEQLESFLDNREVSPRGDPHPVGPIEIDYPALYAAEQHVERLMGGILPMGPWEHWNELLELSRKKGGDPKRSRLAYIEADHVLTWAMSPAAATAPASGFLNLVVDEARHTVERNSRKVGFGNKFKAWLLFWLLFRAREHGCSRDELMDELWGTKAVEPSNLDHQKFDACAVLETLGIIIESDNRGIWRLALVIQTMGTRAPNV